MLVLLVLFGSVTAILMPIMTVLVAIGAGISVNSLVTHVLNENTATLAIALMIALGVGIDYSLFIVSRFRGLLAEGRKPDEAAAGAVNTSGRAVLLAGTNVVLALLVMVMLGVSITTGIAVGAAIEAAFTMAAALTLLPAVPAPVRIRCRLNRAGPDVIRRRRGLAPGSRGRERLGRSGAQGPLRNG